MYFIEKSPNIHRIENIGSGIRSHSLPPPGTLVAGGLPKART